MCAFSRSRAVVLFSSSFIWWYGSISCFLVIFQICFVRFKVWRLPWIRLFYHVMEPFHSSLESVCLVNSGEVWVSSTNVWNFTVLHFPFYLLQKSTQILGRGATNGYLPRCEAEILTHDYRVKTVRRWWSSVETCVFYNWREFPLWCPLVTQQTWTNRF